MNVRSRLLIFSIIIGMLFYISDSMLDYYLSYRHLEFFKVFLTDPPQHELYTRLLGVGLILLMRIVLPGVSGSRVSPAETGKLSRKLSSDPSLMVRVSNQIKTPLSAILGFG